MLNPFSFSTNPLFQTFAAIVLAIPAFSSVKTSVPRLDLNSSAITYQSQPDTYYALMESVDLHAFNPIAAEAHGTTSTLLQKQFEVPSLKTTSAFYQIRAFSNTIIHDLDSDGISDFFELENPDILNPLNPNDPYRSSEGSYFLYDREAFNTMAHRDNFPGAVQVPEIKFLIEKVDTEHPRLYFINTNNIIYHYDFAFYSLGYFLSVYQFSNRTYFNDNRSFISGSLIAHDHFQSDTTSNGIYTIEFWPTDTIRFKHVSLAYDLLAKAMPFAKEQLFYHPSSETQRTLFEAEKALYQTAQLPLIHTEALFQNITYEALNPGIAYGKLILAEGAQQLSAQDIVIFETIPNNLSHISGILTTLPQTPLSHVNLKAKQNKTPNAYIKNGASDPEIQALIGQYVRYEVSADTFSIELATAEEVETYILSKRPEFPQYPLRDLSVTTIQPLAQVRFDHSTSLGAKAANLAELATILPNGMVPDGYAIPFYFYDEFMKFNNFYAEVEALPDTPNFTTDPNVRDEALDEFRKRIKKGELPPWMLNALQSMHDAFPSEQSIRCRSSTNNEDLPDFNGAGLYDSYTHHPDEGHISKSIKQVWASLWTYRAFEERDFHRIDHLTTAMGVLVHPNFSDEQVNGVAVTKNIYDINWAGYYVNTQVGEDLVTNPDAASTPEEFLVAQLAGSEPYEIQYIRYSNQIEPNERLLTKTQIFQLADQMEKIQEHFKPLYQSSDPNFAMEIEFKITEAGTLSIKQARPWID